MIVHPNFDPVALSIGPLKIHWYGLMYLIGFLGGYWLGVYRAGRPSSAWRKQEVADLLVYIAIGVVLGGRLGFVSFYQPAYYFSNPLEIFFVWRGGMSFHGGLIGVIVATWLFGRHTSRGFWQVADFMAPLAPLGLGAGRIGNFINQELWGRVTDVPWAMVFTTDPQRLPRHPSMLYEAFLEGVVLFILVWVYSARPRQAGAVSGLFLLGYGVFRFLVEFVREPDAHSGFIAFGWMTTGQALSVPMILFGLWLLWRSSKTPTVPAG